MTVEEKVKRILTLLNELEDEELEVLSKALNIICARRIDKFEKHDIMNEDASQRLAYGLCKRYGIDTTGMSPRECWEALKAETGKGPKEFYSQSGAAGSDKVKFGTANAKSFSKALQKAKSNVDKKLQWRVTGMNRSQVKEWHENAKLHVTDGGSTIAVDDGDIVAVCGNPFDELRGKDLIAFAVKNGGNKLDSYEGNHGFYCKCGFEPVSWCKWDEQYAPDGWRESGMPGEDIIFYKYTGRTTTESAEDFKRRVKPCEGENAYDDAYEMRDKSI